MRLRKFFTAGGAICVLTLSFLATKHLRSQQILGSRVRPYTINIYEKSTTFAKPTATVIERRSFRARRSDGSTVDGTFTKLQDNSFTLTRSISLIGERRKVLVHDLTRSILTEFFSGETALRLKAPPADPSCRSDPDSIVASRVIGEGSIHGFPVVKLLLETQAPQRNSGKPRILIAKGSIANLKSRVPPMARLS